MQIQTIRVGQRDIRAVVKPGAKDIQAYVGKHVDNPLIQADGVARLPIPENLAKSKRHQSH